MWGKMYLFHFQLKGMDMASLYSPLNTQKQIPLSSPMRPRTGKSTHHHHSCASFSSPAPKLNPDTQKTQIQVSKRMLNLSMLTFVILPELKAQELSELELERYTDPKEGFTLVRPSSWIKVDKAGATVLFEDPNKGSNNIGVVVTPVRLTRLSQFGDPQFVADKLIQAEKRKESTKEAEVISVSMRPSKGGDLEVYEFEYRVDSTRGGLKRIFSAAFVVSKKLYLLNISHLDNPERPLDEQRRLMLEKVLHSFDVAPFT